jgi:hypothetical protein
MDPMHRDPPRQQRRRQHVQRLVALNIAKQNRGFGRRGERGEAGFTGQQLSGIPISPELSSLSPISACKGSL